MYKFLNRSFQAVARPASKVLDWREPELFVGQGQFNALPQTLKEKDISRLLIVTDEGIREAGLLDTFVKELDKRNIGYEIYDEVESNPSVEIAEEIAIMYNKIHADAILALGGGSVIDAAKAGGVAVVNPQKPLESFQGLMAVRQDIPYLIGVPTTAGTGSEGTLAAVITDSKSRRKYTMMDTHLIPHMAVLDHTLTESLPPQLIAGPGMDALTHAVEAYIGQSNTEETIDHAETAVELIFDNLIKVYDDNQLDQARENMLKASYYAGRAFHRAYVGNVHAMSHALSAFYNLPHGQTNATILPLVLKLYGEAVHQDLAKLAQVAGIAREGASDKDNAEIFIQAIEDMNDYMDIDSRIEDIQDQDLKDLADHAEAEANPLYPVPVIFKTDDFIEAFKVVRGDYNE